MPEKWGASINMQRKGMQRYFAVVEGAHKNEIGELIQLHQWGGVTLRFDCGDERTYAAHEVEEKGAKHA